jgi:hypothetical protein
MAEASGFPRRAFMTRCQDIRDCFDTVLAAESQGRMTSQIQFDAERHLYTVGGVEVPSVTQVLADVGIVDYRFLDTVPGAKEFYTLRGTAVHKLTEDHDKAVLGAARRTGGTKPLPSPRKARGGAANRQETTPYAGYLGAWRRFCADTGFRPKLIEHRGYCSIYMYCGTVDRVGEMPDGSLALPDIKTGSVEWWVALQTAAYANFFPNPARYRRMGVALRDDSTYKITEFRCSDFSRDLNVFLAALTVYKNKRLHRK